MGGWVEMGREEGLFCMIEIGDRKREEEEEEE